MNGLRGGCEECVLSPAGMGPNGYANPNQPPRSPRLPWFLSHALWRPPRPPLQVTSNRSLDGVLDTLNSRNMTDAGPLQLIDHEDKVREWQGKRAMGGESHCYLKIQFTPPGTGQLPCMPNNYR